MRQALQQIQKSTFIRHNAIFFVGSIAIGALNYLYYPVLGRLLPPTSFGEVQTLFSLFAQATIFLSVLSLVTVNIIVNEQDSTQGSRVILELERLSLSLGFIGLIISILGGITLQHFFNFSSAAPFAILALALIASIPLTFRNAYLRGKQKFGLVSWAGVIGAAGDLVFSVIFVLGHTGTTGAIAGLVIAQIVAFAFATVAAHRYGFMGRIRHHIARVPDLRLILPELKYALLVFIGSLGITLFYSMDILLVKHYFDAHVAGLYAGISTVGRIIFFLTASIAQVLMSAVRISSTPTHNQQVLVKSFLLLLFIGGVAWIIFALAPRLVIRLLMGHKYLPYANLLPRFSLVLLIVSVLNLLVTYHLALRRYIVGLLVIIGLSATLILVSLHHNSLVAVINSLLTGSISLLFLLCGWMAVSKLRNTYKPRRA